MRIYLAGPMRGYPDNNAAEFARVAGELRALGHEVWSPAEADKVIPLARLDDLTMRDYMQRDLPALLTQEVIVLLDGWARSHGACVERHVADVVGMPVFLFSSLVEGGLIPLSTHDWRWRSYVSSR